MARLYATPNPLWRVWCLGLHKPPRFPRGRTTLSPVDRHRGSPTADLSTTERTDTNERLGKLHLTPPFPFQSHANTSQFENGWPQSWAWTMLAPYISYCPANTTRLAWQNFPVLHILNNANINRYSPNDTAQDGSEVVGPRIADPSISNLTTGSCENLNDTTGYACGPAVAHNKSEPLSFVGKKVLFQYDAPGSFVGPNNSYVTATSAGAPKFVAWSQQLNLTYSPFVSTGERDGYTYQPAGFVYGTDGIINGTMAVMLTDLDLFVTPFNASMLNPHIVALGMYAAG